MTDKAQIERHLRAVIDNPRIAYSWEKDAAEIARLRAGLAKAQATIKTLKSTA